METSPLVLQDHTTDQGFRVEAAGPVDLATAPQLWECLRQAIRDSASMPLILDLRQMSFIDSAGIAILVQAAKLLKQEERTLTVLLTPGGQPERVLKLGNFDSLLDLDCSAGGL